MEIWAIVLAAGSGARFGGAKQFEKLGRIPLVDRAVRAARAACVGAVVVLPPDTTWTGSPGTTSIVGGSTRSAPVREGLTHIPETAQIVVVHDAAHPLASRKLFRSVVRAVEDGADAAIPGLPINETVKRVSDRTVVATVTGPELVAAQTPHAFRAEMLRAAHADCADASDDTVLVEAHGGRIVVVPGDPRNVHVTTLAELSMAQRLLGQT
jgi:2-C-methyl-D-erythritol 4-phosphate cytidylyltransferase